MNKFTFKYLKYLIYTDFYRITEQLTFTKFVIALFNNEGFKYCFWMRISNYFRQKKTLKVLLYPISRGILRHYKYKYGISIPFTTSIGEGFYIGHFGSIIVNGNTIIGKNCNISQNVTIGLKVRGKNPGTPIIGNNVYIAPGVKIFGNIKIGDNAALGANSVVTKDIPDNSVVVGIPGKVISNEGSFGYIIHTDYKQFKQF